MAEAPAEATAGKNMLQLVQLRWIAVVGQVATIGAVHIGLNITLPLWPMLAVLLALVGLNFVSLMRLRAAKPVRRRELFLAMLFDMAALTVQLYLSGGATNPFSALYLLQIVLTALLLSGVATWIMLLLAASCFAELILHHRPLLLPPALGDDLFPLYIWGMLFCFVLNASLLVIFLARISGNLRAHDARLADLRRQAVEEDHIVRMGLLASGAAHELGTPLSTLSVILGDWRRMKRLQSQPDLLEEIEEMQAAVSRCKTIVGGILMSSGEARGEAPSITTLRGFLDDLVEGWKTPRTAARLEFQNRIKTDVPIVSDPVLKQVIANVLDNAHEASPAFVGFSAEIFGDDLMLVVHDKGPGFSEEMLSEFGKPYRSSKGRLGGGLGLFLVVNVFRKLGGRVFADNREEGGAIVTLVLPLASLAIAEPRHVG